MIKQLWNTTALVGKPQTLEVAGTMLLPGKAMRVAVTRHIDRLMAAGYLADNRAGLDKAAEVAPEPEVVEAPAPKRRRKKKVEEDG